MQNDIEIWKPIPIPGFENKYLASNLGRIKGPRKILTPRIRGGYYYFADICVAPEFNRRRRLVKVHRLVVMAFLGPCPNNCGIFKHSIYCQVNHKDGNKLNNNVNNLEYCTPKENNDHALRFGLYKPAFGEKQWLHVLTEAQVKNIVELLKTSMFIKDIAKTFNVCSGTIRAIKYGNNWTRVTKIIKYRAERGKKLNSNKVLEIVNLLSLGISKTEIAKKFNVSDVLICFIDNGKSWSKVTGRKKMERKKYDKQIESVVL